MDLVGACRAFVSVSDRGSFTIGAAAARMAQSVASRRVAALEKHFGEQLFERSSRQVTLTPFGREMLPVSRRLVRLADRMEEEAAQARRAPFRLALPQACSTAGLARLIADARRHGIVLAPRAVPPAERAELVRTHEVRAALVAVPPGEAVWTVPLGLATARYPGPGPVHLETLRPGRTDDGPPRCVRLQPEDDVPHVRDRVTRLCDAVGLMPAQLSVATDLASAAAGVLGPDGGLLLCSPAQAGELDLYWRPVGELALARGYCVDAAAETDAARLRTRLGPALARYLGAAGEHGGAR